MNAVAALCLLAIMIGWPAVGVAQEPKKDLEFNFGISGGRTAPLSDTRDVLKDGFNGQGFLRVELATAPIAIRAGLSYQNFDLVQPLTLDGVTRGGTQTLVGMLADLQVFLPGRRVRPYVLAGCGVYKMKTELDGDDGPTATETRFGAGGGAGVELAFDGLRVYLEGRVDRVFTSANDPLGEGVQFAPVSFGVMF